jgi:hypothetical protein
VWQSGGVLFLALKMSQDPVDDVLVLNACDDPDRTTARLRRWSLLPKAASKRIDRAVGTRKLSGWH